MDLWRERGQEFELEAKRQEINLADFEAKKKKICELLENGTYSQVMFKDRLEEIENKIAITKISLNEAKIEQFDIEAAVTYATNFIKDLGRQWLELSPKLRPRFQKLVFPNGLSYHKVNGYGTAKLGLIYEINNRSRGNVSQLVGPVGIEPTTSSMSTKRSANEL